MCTKVLPRPHLASTAHSKPNARSQTKPRPASLAPPTPRRKIKVARSNGTVDTPRQSCLSRRDGYSYAGLIARRQCEGAGERHAGGWSAGRPEGCSNLCSPHKLSARPARDVLGVSPGRERNSAGRREATDRTHVPRRARHEPSSRPPRAEEGPTRGAGCANFTFFCKFLGLCLVNGWTSYAKDN